MTHEQLIAWAAGFYEGEGGCTVKASYTQRRLYKYPRIGIGQVNLEPLMLFQQAVGGIGNIQGPHSNGGTRNPIYKFDCYKRADVKIIIDLLYPYLSKVKRKQIRDTLSECEDW